MSLTPLLYAVIAASANVLGAAAVTARARWSVRALDVMVALSAGFMIAVSLGELLPESIERGGRAAALAALAGYLLVHLTQHTFARHFHFGEETHEVNTAVSASALVGLLLHTFFDGVAIASGFEVSPALGFLVFMAILLHKLPEGLAISSLFLAAGAGRRAALGAAAALGVATVAGVLLTEYLAGLREFGLALSAGVTLYVAASNLVPEFQSKLGMADADQLLRGVRALLRGAHGGRSVSPRPSRGPSHETSLFSRAEAAQPLAARLRPRTLDEYVGQMHILAPGKSLRQAIENGSVGSVIFWGPPGSGKTTLGRLIASTTNRVFVPFSAVSEGVPRIRQIIAEARQRLDDGGARTIMFIDEIHRLNKSQQDSLLPAVEDGTVTLIGATTENPSFEINGALLSRSRVFVLHALATSDLRGLLTRALSDTDRGIGAREIVADDDALDVIATEADGDARRALTVIEAAADYVGDRGHVTTAVAREACSFVSRVTTRAARSTSTC